MEELHSAELTTVYPLVFLASLCILFFHNTQLRKWSPYFIKKTKTQKTERRILKLSMMLSLFLFLFVLLFLKAFHQQGVRWCSLWLGLTSVILGGFGFAPGWDERDGAASGWSALNDGGIYKASSTSNFFWSKPQHQFLTVLLYISISIIFWPVIGHNYLPSPQTSRCPNHSTQRRLNLPNQDHKWSFDLGTLGLFTLFRPTRWFAGRWRWWVGGRGGGNRAGRVKRRPGEDGVGGCNEERVKEEVPRHLANLDVMWHH